MPILPNGIPHYKAAMRHHMKVARADLAEQERAQSSRIVCEKLGNWLQSRAETRIAIYLARAPELDLDELAAELLRRNQIVCAPRVGRAAGAMKFVRFNDGDELARGAFGIRQPKAGEIVRPEIALVPGLAFDRSGGRLGMGGGYYDRVLAEIPVKVGVCFGAQILDFVPMQNHDVKMDWLASELGIARCGE